VISRLLFAIDRVEFDRGALEAVVAIATTYGALVRVVHVRKGDCVRGNRYLETIEEAWNPVNEAVFELRMEGLGTSGQVVRAPVGQVAQAIEEEARAWGADAILLGPGKTSRLGRHFARPVRSRLDRISQLLIIAVPPSHRSVSGEFVLPSAARAP
jgi:nucleotide-binding universal stress UspA family protein